MTRQLTIKLGDIARADLRAELPVAVLVGAGLLPVRANRFCRFAAATGLLSPAGHVRTAYPFPHMISVDYFADHD